MRVHTAFFALAASVLAASPASYSAHGGGLQRYHKRDDAGYYLDKGYGHSSKHGSDRIIISGKHEDDDGGHRDLRDSKNGGHHEDNVHHHERKGPGGDSFEGRHLGRASGTRVTSRSGGSRIKRDGHMRVWCSPLDSRSKFVVDMVECRGDCCDDEDYCGEFVMNLGDHVPCLTEDFQEEEEFCDFQLTLPAKALLLDTTNENHEYRIRVTDGNDEEFESCSPPISIEPPDDPTAAPTTAAPTTPSPTTAAPTTAAPTTAAPTTAAPTTPSPTTADDDFLLGGGDQPVTVRDAPVAEPTAAPTPCVPSDDDDDEATMWAPTCPS